MSSAMINGRVVRAIIGKHGLFTPEQARNEARELLANMVKATEVAKKQAARMAVARVSVLPTPRDENKLPEPPPMPKAPPSDLCSITRPINMMATIK